MRRGEARQAGAWKWRAAGELVGEDVSGYTRQRSLVEEAEAGKGEAEIVLQCWGSGYDSLRGEEEGAMMWLFLPGEAKIGSWK